MKVILRKDVEKLGKTGSCISVKDGYARNYLFLRDLAFVASDGSIKKVQEEIAKNQSRMQKELVKLQQLAEKLTNVSCTVTVQAIDDKKIFGSVAKEDVQKALETDGFKIDPKCIILDKPIKELGVYDVMVRLHPQVQAAIKVWVVKK